MPRGWFASTLLLYWKVFGHLLRWYHYLKFHVEHYEIEVTLYVSRGTSVK